MSDKKTCGDCPWGGSPAVLELEGGTRVDVWQWCQIGREGAGLLIKEHPECQFRKAYRVLRDEVRRLRMKLKCSCGPTISFKQLKEIAPEIAEAIEKGEPVL